MPLQSMTGFARVDGRSGRYQWAWELRSVNGKGLDVRLRLATGFERLEADARRLLSADFARGNIQASLTVQSVESRVTAVINRPALDAVLALRHELGDLIDPAPMALDTLLGLRGVVDFRDAAEEPEEIEALDRSVLEGLAEACASMRKMREAEGAALGAVLLSQVTAIETLAGLIESDTSRSPDQIRERLRVQVEALIEAAGNLDRDRLHTEVALLATKADIREELDRLGAHIAATRDLIARGGPIGRKLDFMAQEFNRESNTICSKSNSAAVTAAGIELKVVIDQFREQVQNLE
ncbi:YicC/YloC family endoribonuclease [Rhizobium alvei]|uniref:YicC/YloC family endoribonuclease n=1 Tax=Rhizobium alvei TaxID=1132659 RepID=A0ABT8YJ01_9HYPH|nr:YicC/YloC family endoribonuclease [Rhizobium alvei]MDO6963673.1 YicC/YloC family endoribonuclease [Rhizobium alvei]